MDLPFELEEESLDEPLALMVNSFFSTDILTLSCLDLAELSWHSKCFLLEECICDAFSIGETFIFLRHFLRSSQFYSSSMRQSMMLLIPDIRASEDVFP